VVVRDRGRVVDRVVVHHHQFVDQLAVGEHGVEDRTDRGRLVAAGTTTATVVWDFRLMTRSRLNSSRLSVHGTSGLLIRKRLRDEPRVRT